jgi:hypothetical protein
VRRGDLSNSMIDLPARQSNHPAITPVKPLPGGLRPSEVTRRAGLRGPAVGQARDSAVCNPSHIERPARPVMLSKSGSAGVSRTSHSYSASNRSCALSGRDALDIDGP